MILGVHEKHICVIDTVLQYISMICVRNFRLCMVNYIILYKKFVEHHVIKLTDFQ